MRKTAIWAGLAMALVACGGDGATGRAAGSGGAATASGGVSQASGGATSNGVANVGNVGNESSTGGDGSRGAQPAGVLLGDGEPTNGPNDGGLCWGPYGDCTNSSSLCCSDETCIPLAGSTDGKAYCAPKCLKDSDCSSGCCAKPGDASVPICEPATECGGSCTPVGSSCVGNPYVCCSHSVCVAELTPTTTDYETCTAICTSNADCTSGCCAPVTNSTVKVCGIRALCGI